ncbi:hypothetical protein [Nocardia colli]|uniref:hypothetical protein n=1 Tax=Nocardia colli TaxID=2545717 RepID=UPI001CC797D3|nr:hypothetical protein [Nocardia colli]
MNDNGEIAAPPEDSTPVGSSNVVAEQVSAEAEPSPAARKRLRLVPGRTGRLALQAAAAVLLCAAVASTVFFYLQNKGNKATIDANADARAAACKYAPILADYDAKKLDDYFAAVLDGATGDWKKQFDSTSKELREVLTQGEVVSKVNDVQCAIKTGDESSAEAIVVIGQTITSMRTQGKPAPGQLSMVMRLAKVGDRWLVNKVNSPLAPPAQP